MGALHEQHVSLLQRGLVYVRADQVVGPPDREHNHAESMPESELLQSLSNQR